MFGEGTGAVATGCILTGRVDVEQKSLAASATTTTTWSANQRRAFSSKKCSTSGGEGEEKRRVGGRAHSSGEMDEKTQGVPATRFRGCPFAQIGVQGCLAARILYMVYSKILIFSLRNV